MHNKREGIVELELIVPGINYQLQKVVLVTKLRYSTGTECVRRALFIVFRYIIKQVRKKACEERVTDETD